VALTLLAAKQLKPSTQEPCLHTHVHLPSLAKAPSRGKYLLQLTRDQSHLQAVAGTIGTFRSRAA
jgi:hypothetical protein